MGKQDFGRENIMQAIKLTAVVDEQRILSLVLPPDTSVGEVDVIITPRVYDGEPQSRADKVFAT
jgi:hypothetical protein